jgi:plasmid stabilization system protein ParE
LTSIPWQLTKLKPPNGGTGKGAPYLENCRRILLHRFPFFIVYRFRQARIEIVAVAHARRRPGYWRER